MAVVKIMDQEAIRRAVLRMAHEAVYSWRKKTKTPMATRWSSK